MESLTIGDGISADDRLLTNLFEYYWLTTETKRSPITKAF